MNLVGSSPSLTTETTWTLPQPFDDRYVGRTAAFAHRLQSVPRLRPGNPVLVAVEGNAILAVGAVTDGGMITLNYVSPDARFRGVSGTLLAALEVRALERGDSRCTLASTETAHRFCQTRGYVDGYSPTGVHGAITYPMFKILPSECQTRITSSS